MGIKHFWIWFKENFGNDIKTHNNIYKIDTFGIDVDMLAIDMNGIFHTCAQSDGVAARTKSRGLQLTIDAMQFALPAKE